jgi:hypothetical protein
MSTCCECRFNWNRSRYALADDVRLATGLELPADDSRIRTRPEPSVWSALEYTAHLRDALRFYDDRIRRTLTEDRPQLCAYGFHEACERLDYNAETVTRTLAGLRERAHTLAARVAGLDATQWARIAIGSDGDERTVLMLARRAAHEVQHHDLDIRRVLDTVNGSRHAD